MDIFAIITLVGGLALFLYGMNVMSQGLEKLAGGKLEAILKRMTSNAFKSLLLGVGITAIIQSSSAITVMLVGLVNSGIMEIGQTVGVIMGSNIGTTVTAWLLSLVGIESDNLLLKMLKPSSFSPLLACVGVIMLMVCKKSKKRDIGSILVGFAILMTGMEFMSGAVTPLADDPDFASMLIAFKNPLLGLLTGLVLTAIIQSSSASVGILQALSMTNGITYGMAIPIIMGQNIGTCVTAVISSVGVSKNAKRVAIIHISFNIIGSLACLLIYMLCDYIFDMAALDKTINPVGVAVAHTCFNLFTTAMLLPFSKWLVKLAKDTIKVEPERKVGFLDERLLKTPSVALRECHSMMVEMAYLAGDTVFKAMDMMKNYSEEDIKLIEKMEKDVDKYEDRIGSFLVKLSSVELSDRDARRVAQMLYSIGDIERVSDHGLSIMKAIREKEEQGVQLSQSADEEIRHLGSALRDIMALTLDAFKENDLDKARQVEPFEEVIDNLTEYVKERHVQRLTTGECTMEQGFVLNELLISYERISDHCSNIAVAMLEIAKDRFETHKYMKKLKTRDGEKFREDYLKFARKYGFDVEEEQLRLDINYAK